MSRLLTTLLFYKAGYIVGKYVSMEMLIEKTKETYYEALQASSTGWHGAFFVYCASFETEHNEGVNKNRRF